MNLAKLVFAFIARKPLTWAFHVVTLAIGVGVVVSVMLLSQALDNRVTRDLANVDLVVGAKGSPLQLIMSSLFGVDSPTGNIPLSVAERLEHNMFVAQAITLSLGDSVHGLRIVGTTPDYAGLYHAELATGAWWSAPMQVVLGADAAKQLNLAVGGEFSSQHGLSGGETHGVPYRVVGVLKPTGAVIDRLVLTSRDSIWNVHEHADTGGEREVTAVLIRYRSAMGAVMLPPMLASLPNVQTAVPAMEAARLNTLMGTGANVLRWFGVGLLALSALGFFVALFAAVQQRQRELALLRVLGAGWPMLLAVVVLEALLLGLLGGVLGIGVGRAMAQIAADAVGARGGPMLLLAPFGSLEAAALAAAAVLSVAAAAAPSMAAARIDPAQTLKS